VRFDRLSPFCCERCAGHLGQEGGRRHHKKATKYLVEKNEEGKPASNNARRLSRRSCDAAEADLSEFSPELRLARHAGPVPP
jgi:hypothetical protein